MRVDWFKVQIMAVIFGLFALAAIGSISMCIRRQAGTLGYGAGGRESVFRLEFGQAEPVKKIKKGRRT